MLNTRWSKTEEIFTEAPWQQTGQTFFDLEIRGYRLLQNARLSREERQMFLAGTRNDTEYTAIVTQLRSAWEDQDLRDRDRQRRQELWKGPHGSICRSRHRMVC